MSRLAIQIAQLAGRQQGNITRVQLLALGMSPPAIHRWVKLGRLYRVHRGVYAVGRPPITPLEKAAAAVLACGPRAALSHGSAMTLWGFWKRWDEPFEVSVVGDRRPKGIRTHRPAGLLRRDLRTHLGIRVTTPARTILDITSRLDDAELGRAVDNALHSKFLHRSHLAEELLRHPGHRSTPRLVYFVTTEDGPSRSDWERAFPAFCATHDLPRPILGANVAGHEVDALWPQERLIIELDSWEFHHTRTAFETDRDRDADTLAADHATVRITWERMLTRPQHEADRLHAIRQARRPEAA